jgi:hypothetical protein
MRYQGYPQSTNVEDRRGQISPLVKKPPTLTERAIQALGALGNIVDLPGSSARDVIGLAGSAFDGDPNWEKYNPFDQWATPTKSTNRVYGRDLLEAGGILNDNTPGLDFGDVAGFGVDLITDPFNLGMAGRAFSTARAGSRARAANQTAINQARFQNVANAERTGIANRGIAGERLDAIANNQIREDMLYQGALPSELLPAATKVFKPVQYSDELGEPTFRDTLFSSPESLEQYRQYQPEAFQVGEIAPIASMKGQQIERIDKALREPEFHYLQNNTRENQARLSALEQESELWGDLETIPGMVRNPNEEIEGILGAMENPVRALTPYERSDFPYHAPDTNEFRNLGYERNQARSNLDFMNTYTHGNPEAAAEAQAYLDEVEAQIQAQMTSHLKNAPPHINTGAYAIRAQRQAANPSQGRHIYPGERLYSNDDAVVDAMDNRKYLNQSIDDTSKDQARVISQNMGINMPRGDQLAMGDFDPGQLEQLAMLAIKDLTHSGGDASSLVLADALDNLDDPLGQYLRLTNEMKSIGRNADQMLDKAIIPAPAATQSFYAVPEPKSKRDLLVSNFDETQAFEPKLAEATVRKRMRELEKSLAKKLKAGPNPPPRPETGFISNPHIKASILRKYHKEPVRFPASVQEDLDELEKLGLLLKPEATASDYVALSPIERLAAEGLSWDQMRSHPAVPKNTDVAFTQNASGQLNMNQNVPMSYYLPHAAPYYQEAPEFLPPPEVVEALLREVPQVNKGRLAALLGPHNALARRDDNKRYQFMPERYELNPNYKPSY